MIANLTAIRLLPGEQAEVPYETVTKLTPVMRYGAPWGIKLTLSNGAILYVATTAALLQAAITISETTAP